MKRNVSKRRIVFALIAIALLVTLTVKFPFAVIIIGWIIAFIGGFLAELVIWVDRDTSIWKYLLIPFYSWYYAFKHWDEMKQQLLVALAGVIIAVIGMVFYFIPIFSEFKPILNDFMTASSERNIEEVLECWYSVKIDEAGLTDFINNNSRLFIGYRGVSLDEVEPRQAWYGKGRTNVSGTFTYIDDTARSFGAGFVKNENKWELIFININGYDFNVIN